MAENGYWKKWASLAMARSRLENDGVVELWLDRGLRKYGLPQLVIT